MSIPLACPNSVTGHAQNDASGRCCWCGKQIDPPIPHIAPHGEASDLTEAYEAFYSTDDPEDRDAIALRYRLGQA